MTGPGEHVHVEVVGAHGLSAGQRAAVLGLLAARREATGHVGLPEPQLRAVEHGDGGAGDVAETLTYVLASRDGDGGALVGCALLSTVADGSRTVHVVTGEVEVADALIDATVETAGGSAGGPIHLWAMQASISDDELAGRHGFAPERDLLQMRVPLPLGHDVVGAVTPVRTRPFDPARDAAVWLDVNNRAFADHPEQGHWTVATLEERLGAEWVDLEGFLVADAPEGDGIIGSCWTKIHRDSDPLIGEIYVISVDPDRHGKGWGKSLTVAGLEWLAGQGVTIGMLYTDADNQAALATYGWLGFRVDHIDREYVRA